MVVFRVWSLVLQTLNIQNFLGLSTKGTIPLNIFLHGPSINNDKKNKNLDCSSVEWVPTMLNQNTLTHMTHLTPSTHNHELIKIQQSSIHGLNPMKNVLNIKRMMKKIHNDRSVLPTPNLHEPLAIPLLL